MRCDRLLSRETAGSLAAATCSRRRSPWSPRRAETDSMNVWPTLELAGLLLLLWTECRLLALRTTVSPRRFLQLFAWGCIGATAVSLLVARLLSIRMGTA